MDGVEVFGVLRRDTRGVMIESIDVWDMSDEL